MIQKMKNRPSFLILSTLLLATGTLQAQRIFGFASAGATLSQIEGDELKGFRKWGFSGGVGAIASLDRQGDWNLSIEALFSQRGCYNRSGNPFSLSLTTNYVDIPLMLHYRDPWGGMLIGLGLSYGRLVEQPHGKLKFDTTYIFPDTTNMDFLKNDFSVVADIRFFVWRGLMLNIRWQYSLTAVKRDWEFTEMRGRDASGNLIANKWNNDCYNNSLSFRLIWMF